MKKFYPFISVVPGVGGLIWFLWRVRYLASLHMDYELSVPLLWVPATVLALIVVVLCKIFKKTDNRYFWIPGIYFICGIIAFWVGMNTGCPACGAYLP